MGHSPLRYLIVHQLFSLFLFRRERGHTCSPRFNERYWRETAKKLRHSDTSLPINVTFRSLVLLRRSRKRSPRATCTISINTFFSPNVSLRDNKAFNELPAGSRIERRQGAFVLRNHPISSASIECTDPLNIAPSGDLPLLCLIAPRRDSLFSFFERNEERLIFDEKPLARNSRYSRFSAHRNLRNR